MIKLFNLSLLSIILVTSCTSNINSLINISETKTISNLSNKNYIIKGNIDWGKSFSIKATINDISPYGTVSLLYPHNHATFANRTIATGLTDSGGSFTITTSDFTPVTNEIYVLEVFKRLGGIGNHLMSLRTFIRHSGTSWESITTPSISINNKTSALAIIANTEPISPSLTIGTINNGTPTDIPTTSITATIINNVSSLVDTVLTANYDPFKYISKPSSTYVNTNP